MRMPPFQVHSPESLDEALEISRALSDSEEEFDWIAGGTDLLPNYKCCLLYTSPSPRDKRQSRMPSSA